MHAQWIRRHPVALHLPAWRLNALQGRILRSLSAGPHRAQGDRHPGHALHVASLALVAGCATTGSLQSERSLPVEGSERPEGQTSAYVAGLIEDIEMLTRSETGSKPESATTDEATTTDEGPSRRSAEDQAPTAPFEPTGPFEPAGPFEQAEPGEAAAAADMCREPWWSGGESERARAHWWERPQARAWWEREQRIARDAGVRRSHAAWWAGTPADAHDGAVTPGH